MLNVYINIVFTKLYFGTSNNEKAIVKMQLPEDFEYLILR